MNECQNQELENQHHHQSITTTFCSYKHIYFFVVLFCVQLHFRHQLHLLIHNISGPQTHISRSKLSTLVYNVFLSIFVAKSYCNGLLITFFSLFCHFPHGVANTTCTSTSKPTTTTVKGILSLLCGAMFQNGVFIGHVTLRTWQRRSKWPSMRNLRICDISTKV